MCQIILIVGDRRPVPLLLHVAAGPTEVRLLEALARPTGFRAVPDGLLVALLRHSTSCSIVVQRGSLARREDVRVHPERLRVHAEGDVNILAPVLLVGLPLPVAHPSNLLQLVRRPPACLLRLLSVLCAGVLAARSGLRTITFIDQVQQELLGDVLRIHIVGCFGVGGAIRHQCTIPGVVIAPNRLDEQNGKLPVLGLGEDAHNPLQILSTGEMQVLLIVVSRPLRFAVEEA
mmetsp:Transcript_9736/g.36551  ORF Transcript_9736/g.36551 Transcript_9736/m.36551 type:complete len:232 (+) Transcript_9736:1327-2022(+)